MNYIKSFLFFIFFGYATITTGQDVGLPWMIYPVPNQQVHLQYTYDIEIVVKNYSSSAVPKNAGMTFILLFDGLVQGNFSLNAHPKINPGDSLNVTINNQSFSTPNATMEVSVVVDYSGDLNKGNDTITNILGFSVDDNVDLGPTSIDIVIPNVDSVLAPGSTISLMRATISNFGTVTLPREYVMKIESKMYGQTNGAFTGVTTTAFDSTGSVFINVSGQQPKIQSSNGPFQICISIINNPDDKNNSNDDYCQIFYAYDWTSVQEVEENNISSYSYRGNLQLNNLPEGLQSFRIYNLQGQIVFKEEILSQSSSGLINVSQLERGIYLLKVFRGNKVIHSNKFSIDW